MTEPKKEDLEGLFRRIKLLSNRKKFSILKATQKEEKNITELSKELKLAYNKCSNYVTELEKENLVMKVREGKEVYIKSKVKLSEDELKPDKNKKKPSKKLKLK